MKEITFYYVDHPFVDEHVQPGMIITISETDSPEMIKELLIEQFEKAKNKIRPTPATQ